MKVSSKLRNVGDRLFYNNEWWEVVGVKGNINGIPVLNGFDYKIAKVISNTDRKIVREYKNGFEW